MDVWTLLQAYLPKFQLIVLGWRTPVSNCYKLKRSKQPNSPWPWEDSIWREGACAPQKTIEATPFGPCFWLFGTMFSMPLGDIMIPLEGSSTAVKHPSQLQYQVWPATTHSRETTQIPKPLCWKTYLQNEWNNPIYMKSTSISFKNRTCCAQPISDPNHL